VQQVAVKDERDREPDRECAKRNKDSRSQLVEMLDERRLLTLAKAARQAFH
jgi:hypothetical protein